MDRLDRRSTRGFVAAALGLALAFARMPSAAADAPAAKPPAEKPAGKKAADAKPAGEKPADEKPADEKSATPEGAAATEAPAGEGDAAPEDQEAPRKPKKKKKSSAPQAMALPPLPPPPPQYVLPPLPRRLDYEEGDVVMPEYQRKSRADRALVTSGALSFGVPYVISAVFGFGSGLDRDGGAVMLIPLVGPFIASGESPRNSSYGKFFLLADGFAQIAGVALFTAGLVFPYEYLEVRPEALTARVRPELVVGPGSLAVRGRF